MRVESALLAFGFGNLLMLGWLAAAAAPILIHLWNRRRYREEPWAAMSFLLAAIRNNARRIRVEQWLLLAVRTLLVVLVVLAMAEPYLEQAGLGLVGGQRTLKVIVVDGSYSMAYKPTASSRFERARQLAAQLVDDSAEGDAFALVLLGQPPVAVVAAPTADRREFVDEIEHLALVHSGADLPATLAKVEEILASADGARFARREVYFFSDLGRNTWAPDLDGADAQRQFEARLDRLARQAALVVVDLGQAATENAAVTALRATAPLVTAGRELAFEGQVRNFGSQARARQQVELYVDGRRVKEAQVDLPAGQEATVSLAYRFETPGMHAVELRLPSDLLDLDNHRWLCLPVKERISVLCVDGKPATAAMNGAADYLALALDPRAAAGAPGWIRPEVVPESALLERDLAQYDAIFLCNVGQFTASEARALEGYLKQGGGLVFFLGDQVRAERYNQELAGERGPRVLPARIGPLRQEARYQFDPLGYRHPLVSSFAGREQAGLLSTPIYKYFHLQLAESSRAKVALALAGGDPAIVEEPIHRGRSILVATDGSRSSLDPRTGDPWSMLYTWPSFLPLVRKTLTLAASGQGDESNAQVGQSIGGALPVAAAATVKVTAPDGRKEDVRPADEGGGRRWSYADTSLSGVYSAQLAPSLPEQPVAVNLNTSESNLAKLDPSELPRQLSTNRPADLDDQDLNLVTPRSAVHRALLYAALALLFTETFLAWRFGHPGK